jgi:MFS family permease
MGAINSYPQYRSYFGFPLDEGTPSTGIVYAIYTIGNLVGSFAAGPATDFRGKRQQSKHSCEVANKFITRSPRGNVHWRLDHHHRNMCPGFFP